MCVYVCLFYSTNTPRTEIKDGISWRHVAMQTARRDMIFSLKIATNILQIDPLVETFNIRTCYYVSMTSSLQ